jgi:hypothetical protein
MSQAASLFMFGVNMSEPIAPKKPKPLTEKQKEVLLAKKAKQDAKDAKIKAAFEKAKEKERKIKEREDKKKAIEQKRIASAFRAEQRELKKVILLDDHFVKTIILHGKGRPAPIDPSYRSITKDDTTTVLVINPSNPYQAVLSIVQQNNWRNGLWFYDFQKKIHLKFEKEIHKPGHGNNQIVWYLFESYIDSKEVKNE